MQLILASQSPRRRELLKKITNEFIVEPSLYEERAGGLSARETVLTFAKGKAEEVFSRFPHALVLGADTVVFLDGDILGKPKDRAEAVAMLHRLSGRTHTVFTGVYVIGEHFRGDHVVATDVTFHKLSDELIEEYVASGLPLDKAGSYGIQDGYELVAHIAGSYSGVMGLPVEEVCELLARGGYQC